MHNKKAMQKRILNYLHLSATLWITVLLTTSCDKYADVERYQRPDWLVGKIYTQLSSVPELSMFAQCLRDVGYDKILDQSGTYATFAPSDSAFKAYLQDKGYASLDDISEEEKLRLVKSHILQMPWAEVQLQTLSSRGWINLEDESNNKPLAFKRQTLMKNPNKTYPVKIETIDGKEKAIIVPEEESTEERVVYSNSRKYAALFFDDFLTASELSGQDYTFYFDRPYESGAVYYMNAKLEKDELFADNGFIYIIDKVADPLYNAEELMTSFGHTAFLDLIHLNSDFEYNETQTLLQDGADKGLTVDKLFDLSYPGLPFSIHNEIITSSRYTLEYHNGIIVPNNDALNTFINSELVGNEKWSNYNDIPIAIKLLILDSHMTDQPIYKTNIDEGFYNSLGDLVRLDESTITDKYYGSNATYISTNKVIKPQALSSVCNPLYTMPKYQAFLCLYAKVNLLTFLKDADIDYSLFIIDDASIGENGDQSLIQEWTTSSKYKFTLSTINQEDLREAKLEEEDYEKMALGQIGIQPLIGKASKEFIETIDGRHLIIDNSNQTVTGGKSSKYGYNSNVDVVNNFSLIDNYNNGKTYLTNAWINFSSSLTFTEVAKHAKYLSLLKKAGLADEYSLSFISSEKHYTLFIPSDSVIDAHQLGNLSPSDLKEVLSYHILDDELMFTDGRQESGNYETLSTTRQLNIDPEPDVLNVNQSNGQIYHVALNEGTTNIICTKTGPDNYPITEAVIHEINTLFE